MATLEEEYKKYTGEGYDQVNSMYDAQKQATLSGLESAYNQNLSNAQAARDALPEQYQSRANDLAVQYERNRRNLNEQAAANGLNTGAGSQMQLALGSNYQRDYGGIRRAEQQAVNEADRGIRDLQSAYQSSVQQAVADNDYRRAQALLNEYKNQYQNSLNQAQILASYGDFSGYSGIPGYSQQQIDNMRNTWIASNPQLAYSTGAITAEQYKNMTGSWPAGYAAPGGGGYGGGYYYGGGSGTGSTDEEGRPEETIPWWKKMLSGNGIGGLFNGLGSGAQTAGNGNGSTSQVRPFVEDETANVYNNDPDAWLDYQVRIGRISRADADRLKAGG